MHGLRWEALAPHRFKFFRASSRAFHPKRCRRCPLPPQSMLDPEPLRHEAKVGGFGDGQRDLGVDDR